MSFTAEPAYGYELTGWTVNGEPQNGESDETFTWTVPNGQVADPAVSSYQIEALFELVDTDYTLTYTVAGSGGTISVPGGENGERYRVPWRQYHLHRRAGPVLPRQ